MLRSKKRKHFPDMNPFAFAHDDASSSSLPLPLKKKKKLAASSSSSYYINEEKKEPEHKTLYTDDICLVALQRFWGYQEFRGPQRDIIESLRTFPGQDVLAILSTGAGKSLCFQMPSVVDGGLTLVITPLISLMQDQVHQLSMKQIPAACLYQNQTHTEQMSIYEQIIAGRIHILYVAPERLVNMEMYVRKWQPKWIIVDEAHTVSQFGCSFRPDYRDLYKIREWTPYAKWAAFTATATTDVQQDIIQQLGMQNPTCYVANVDRTNLFYTIQPRCKNRQQFLSSQLYPLLKKHYMQSGIIYCLSRKETEDTAEYLNQCGIEVLPYHAGLDPQVRSETQTKFMNDEIRVISSTVAFSLGLNKPNIRFIINTSLASTIEHIMQDFGRAGRDGELSHCYLFYAPQDFKIRESFLKEIQDEQHLQTMTEKLQTAWNFCKNKHECYHKQMVQYFGQTYQPLTCRNRCSNCVSVEI